MVHAVRRFLLLFAVLVVAVLVAAGELLLSALPARAASLGGPTAGARGRAGVAGPPV